MGLCQHAVIVNLDFVLCNLFDPLDLVWGLPWFHSDLHNAAINPVWLAENVARG
jgi:hypothetical protein